MITDNLLDSFIEQRMNTDLEERLKNTKTYQKATEQSKKTLYKLNELELNEVQKDTLNDHLEAMNDCSAEYGKAAYIQGLVDIV